MPSAAVESSATERLARLLVQRDRARATVDARERELGERRRELASLRAEQEEHERSVGAGGDRDQALERRVAKALAASGVERLPEADGGGLTDRLAEARADGASRAVGEAERELREFCRDHLAAIEGELRQGEVAERAAALEAGRELARALTPMRQRWRRLHGVYVLAGRPADAPRAPFESAARALAAMERE